MARKNRKTKTVEEKYGGYTASTIKLSEDGVEYEVMLDKFIKLMENLFEEDKYKNKTTYDAKMTILLEELNAKFLQKNKQQLSENYGSLTSFKRYFDKPITKKNGPISIEDEKKCIHIIKDIFILLM